MKKLSDQITNTLDSNKTFSHLDTIIKELIENSIDAKAKTISVKLIKYGLELIEVTDDGSGMTYETLSGLGSRFTSTKISSYDDLSKLETFGFRGEALSILSYISTVFIYTRVRSESVGHLAVFKNGKLDEKSGIKQINCNIGTTIQVKNIFYNNVLRQKHFEKTKVEELNLIISTCSKLAFHFINISFKLFCEDSKNGVFVTNPSNKSESPLEVRRKLAVKLFNLNLSDGFDVFNESYSENNDDGADNNTVNINMENIKNQLARDFKFECYHTKPSSYIPKSKLILFINNRLVKNSSLKRMLCDRYNKFLIKHGNFFVYLSISCPPEILDVNVKANKSEVFFKNEDLLWEHFGNMLENVLKREINTKNLYASEFKGFNSGKKVEKNEKKKEEIFDSDVNKKTVYGKDKVRVDNKTYSIERFLSLNKVGSKSKGLQQEEPASENAPNSPEAQKNVLNSIIKSNELYIESAIYKEIFFGLYYTTDINNQVKLNANEILTKIFKHGVYVGYVKDTEYLTLQYETSLYIVNARVLLQEFFMYKVLIGHVDNIKVGGTGFDLEQLFLFVKDRHSSNKNIQSNIEILLKNIDKVKKETVSKISVLIQSLIEFDGTNVKSIKTVNLYENDKFINFFVSYIPLIYYSLIEAVYFNQCSASKTTLQENKNLNLIIDLLKIFCFYHSAAYLDFLRSEGDEHTAIFFKEMILGEIARDKNFVLRENLKEDEICEKLTDTQRLYTVFERC